MFKEDFGDVACETPIIYLLQIIMCLRWDAKQNFNPRGEGKNILAALCTYAKYGHFQKWMYYTNFVKLWITAYLSAIFYYDPNTHCYTYKRNNGVRERMFPYFKRSKNPFNSNKPENSPCRDYS